MCMAPVLVWAALAVFLNLYRRIGPDARTLVPPFERRDEGEAS